MGEGGGYRKGEGWVEGGCGYVVNGDMRYGGKFKKDREVSGRVVYKVEGGGIDGVGIWGLGEVKEEDLDRVDLVGS